MFLDFFSAIPTLNGSSTSTSGLTPRFVCKLCGKSYTAKGSLVRHNKYECQFNTSIASFKCPYCSHESRRKDHLKCHIRKHMKSIQMIHRRSHNPQFPPNEQYYDFDDKSNNSSSTLLY